MKFKATRRAYPKGCTSGTSFGSPVEANEEVRRLWMFLLMTKPFPYWVVAALVMAIAIVQVTADHWHLYFYIWWLDIPVHMAGGFWIGLTSLVLYFHTRQTEQKDRSAKFSFIVALTSAFVIGASWEIFEYVVDRSLADGGIDFVDSLSDIVNDGIGASLATAFFLRRGYNKTI